MPYNIALIVVLVIFLIFAFASGRSLGDIYCAKTQKDREEAQMGLVFNLLFAGLLGWWAYYEYHRGRKCYNLIVVETNERYRTDPNMMAALKKQEEQSLKETPGSQTRETIDSRMAAVDDWLDESTQSQNTQESQTQNPRVRYDLNLDERLQATDQRGDTMNTPGMII